MGGAILRANYTPALALFCLQIATLIQTINQALAEAQQKIQQNLSKKEE